MAESPTMEVRARLSADSAQFTRGLENARRSTESFQAAAGNLNKGLLAVGLASSTAAIALISFGVKSFRAAAQVEELDIALQAIGASSRYGYAQLATTVDEIKKVGITSAAANRAVIKLAQSNVDLTDASKLATVAQNLSVTASVNSADALQTLTFAITTGQTRMLRQIGITANATEAFAIYGKTIGKNASDLTMAERRQAVLNLVIAEGAKVTGAYALAIKSPSKALKEMSDLTNNLQVAVGQKLLASFSKVILATFELFTKFTQAADGTGTFSKFLSAMEKVFTKLADPFAKIATNLGNFIDKIDKSKVSVNGIADVFEKALPIVGAFTAFIGVKAGKEIFQALPIFQGLFKMMNAGVIAFVVFAATSTQVRNAIMELGASLTPLIAPLAKIGAVLNEVLALVTGAVAKAITGLTSAINKSIGFFRENELVLRVLQGVILSVATALVVYKIASMASSAVDKIGLLVKKVKIALLNAEAVSSARASVAEAQHALAIKANNVATALSARQIAALNVQKAAQNLMTIKMTASETILGGKTVAVATAQAGLTASTRALTVATGQVAIAQSGATAAASTLAGAQATLAATSRAMIAPLLIKIALLAGLVYIFIQAYKSSEDFREVVKNVFNSVASIIGKVLAFVFKLFGNLLLGFGELISTTTDFGHLVANVFQFVFQTITFVVSFILTLFKFLIDGFISLMETNITFRKIIEDVFNITARIIGGAVNFITSILAFFIKIIAAVVFAFTHFKDVMMTVVRGVIGGFQTLGKGIGIVFEVIGDAFSRFIGFTKDRISGFVEMIIRSVRFLPDFVEREITSVLTRFNNSLQSSTSAVKEFDNATGTKALEKLTKDTDIATDSFSKLGLTINKGISNILNFDSGVAGALTDVANTLLKVGAGAVKFTALNLGKILGDGLLAGAKVASTGITFLLNQVEKIKMAQVGKPVIDLVSKGAIKAGNFLIGLAGGIESFTTGDTFTRLGDNFASIIEGLKKGLGFGDDLLVEPIVPPGNPAAEAAAKKIEEDAERMKSIRGAMKAGLEGIQNVIDDLREAAADFAKSLKETILGFAGLKSVELPDGFIPKAASLIENMRMRLDKSAKFASQIAQLSALGLDTGALRDVIDSGPIKGAQLAASILGGNAMENISQINALQKAIEFTGAATGAFSADALFSGDIAKAQSKFDSIANSPLSITPSGDNIYIQEGAFKVMIDISKAQTTDEQIEVINQAIEQQFAYLAKQIGNK